METGHGPRFECKDLTMAVSSCYCYKAVRPVKMIKQDTTDKRPFSSGLISSRGTAAGLADGDWALSQQKAGRRKAIAIAFHVKES